MTTCSVNIFELAGQIGQEFFGEIGKTAFEEFELSFASRMSHRFIDFSQFRVFQNLNLYWDKSYLKNVLCDEFRKTLPEQTCIKVTSATVETMFGTISDDGSKLKEPIFYNKDFCFMPELSSFLGVGESMKTKVPVFNEVLEAQETTRTLLKFVNASAELIEKYTTGATSGLFFDGNQLKYYPYTCFIVGTHPLDNKTFTYLDKSGFWSRLHTIQFKISDNQAREIFTGSMNAFNEDKMQLLKQYNIDLMAHRPVKTCKPSDTFLLPILQACLASAEHMTSKFPNLNLKDALNLRVKGDIIREVNAYRILVPSATNEEIQKWASIRAPHFFEFIVNPSISDELTVRKERTLDECVQVIKEKFASLTMKRKDVMPIMTLEEGFSRPTVDRALQSYPKTDYATYKIQ